MILLVKAGAPVDDVISQLKPLLEKGDIIIDGGNSFFKDTQRREKELKQTGFASSDPEFPEASLVRFGDPR
jgi:6-phosphogluconate dehydrogenase